MPASSTPKLSRQICRYSGFKRNVGRRRHSTNIRRCLGMYVAILSASFWIGADESANATTLACQTQIDLQATKNPKENAAENTPPGKTDALQSKLIDDTKPAADMDEPANVIPANTTPANSPSKAKALPKPFDGDAAWQHLVTVCRIGPRISTSNGMKQQQNYLKQHFESIGGKVLPQQFQAISPFNNRAVLLQNMIVQFHPERERRLLICCHYDTRPFADRDQRNPRAKFIGANDGGSGVALLCELGAHLKQMDGPFGVDLIFFDGEEFVVDSRVHPMFLGSTFFAQQYANNQIPWRYEWGILVDMVADKDLQIYYEANSLAPGPDGLTRSIWGVAQRLGIREFIPQKKHIVKDDHLPLNNIAGIPTCDIIDFDFPNPRAGNVYWHTTQDNLKNCSKESLRKVGLVVLTWIREMQTIQRSAQQSSPNSATQKRGN